LRTDGVAGRIVREVSQIDRTGVEPWFGVRCTIGVAIPLVASYAAGYPLSGVSAAIGALVVGFASRQGVYRTRAAAMLFTSAATGISAFVGSISGGHPALSIAITALWGLAVGILASLGPSANAVGLNGLIALIVFSQFGFTPEQAARQALLVFAGGVLQTVLLVLVWPLQRFSAERAVLAKAYGALAAYAANIPQTKLQSPDAQTLSEVEDTLADPQPFAKRGETAVFEALLAEAERIRATLGALVTDRYLFDTQAMGEAEHAVRDLGGAARDVLSAIARSLEDASAPEALNETWNGLARSDNTGRCRRCKRSFACRITYGTTVRADRNRRCTRCITRKLLAALGVRTTCIALGRNAGGRANGSASSAHTARVLDGANRSHRTPPRF
jgi:hypothetical protein